MKRDIHMENLVEKELSDAELQHKIEILEKKLQDQNKFINSIFDAINTPLYIINVQDYKIIKANKACKLPQFSEPVTCYSFSHKSNEPCNTQNHPCTLEIVKRTKKLVRLEHFHYDPMGNLGYYEINAFPIIDEMGEITQLIEYTVDITKRREAEQHLKQSEEKFRTLFDNSSDATFIIDLNGKFLEVNEITCKQLGYTKNELLQLTPENLNFCGENMAELIEALKQFGYLTHNTNYIRRDGVKIPFEINSKLVEYDGKPVIMCIARDITERLKYENMQKKFLSTISHELRTPLAVIIQSLNTLEKHDAQLSDGQKQNLMETMLRNAKLQANMIEEILMLTRIDENQVVLEWEKYDVLEVLTQVLTQLEPYIKAKNIHIIHQITKNLDLFGDTLKIGLIFRIIIDNAIKYSDDNSSLEIIVVDHYKGPFNPRALDGVLITFADTGYGIKAEDLPHIFEKFYRSNETTNIPGSGVGLVIARTLTKLHEGCIYVESQYGKGTKLFLFFPRLEQAPPVQQFE